LVGLCVAFPSINQLGAIALLYLSLKPTL